MLSKMIKILFYFVIMPAFAGLDLLLAFSCFAAFMPLTISRAHLTHRLNHLSQHRSHNHGLTSSSCINFRILNRPFRL